MSVKLKVAEFLVQAGRNGYCDRCLSEVLGLPLLGQVRQVTCELAEEPLFASEAGRCSRCGEEKTIIWCSRISAYAC